MLVTLVLEDPDMCIGIQFFSNRLPVIQRLGPPVGTAAMCRLTLWKI
jgi:hypothetical protein